MQVTVVTLPLRSTVSIRPDGVVGDAGGDCRNALMSFGRGREDPDALPRPAEIERPGSGKTDEVLLRNGHAGSVGSRKSLPHGGRKCLRTNCLLPQGKDIWYTPDPITARRDEDGESAGV